MELVVVPTGKCSALQGTCCRVWYRACAPVRSIMLPSGCLAHLLVHELVVELEVLRVHVVVDRVVGKLRQVLPAHLPWMTRLALDHEVLVQ